MSKKQKSDLLDFYSVHNLQEMPHGHKIRHHILSLAQDILIEKPAQLVRKIRQGIPVTHVELFWSLLTVDGINFLFNRQRPTAAKVVHVIKTSDDVIRPDEERSLYYFKQYILGLDQDDLSDLLHFLTGTTVMPESITVIFRNVTGEARCPIAHTCSNMLELPSTYTSAQDLKREFRSVLCSSHAFEMSII